MRKYIRTKILFSFALVCMIGTLFFISFSKTTVKKIDDDLLFINETGNHRYDKALKLSLRIAKKKVGIENAVIMLKDRPDNRPIEELAVSLFQKYDIGRRTGGKGILLLFIEKDPALKIEVSYELEPIFTDLICNRLEEAARSFILTNNSRDFLTELLVTMNLHYQRLIKDGVEEPIEFSWDTKVPALSTFLSGGGGKVGRGYAEAIANRNAQVTHLPKEDVEKFGPEARPQETLSHYLASLEAGVGDPKLSLLTEGSKIFRMENPRTSSYMRRISGDYKRALPFKVFIQNNLAVALFKAGEPTMPVLMRQQTDGKWLVDEASAWAHFHLFESATEPVPKYDDHEFWFAWEQDQRWVKSQALYPLRVKTSNSYTADLHQEIRNLENFILKNPEDSLGYLRLADLIYFNSYWIAAAVPLYEKALHLNPKNSEIRWRLIDLYLNDTNIEGLLREARALVKQSPEDPLAVRQLEHFEKVYERGEI
jgi:hypothetical protein